MKRWRTPFVMSADSLVAVTTLGVPPTAQAGPLPAGPENPDFETGNLSGWTVVSGTAFANAAVTDRSTFWNGPFSHHGKAHLWGHLAAGDDAQGELRSSSDTVTLSVHASSAESTEIRYRKSTVTLTLDTRKAGYGSQGGKGVWTTTARPDADGTPAIDVLLDRSPVEVFTADGAALTERVHPRYAESHGVEFSAEGGALRIKHARLTQLGSSWTD